MTTNTTAFQQAMAPSEEVEARNSHMNTFTRAAAGYYVVTRQQLAVGSRHLPDARRHHSLVPAATRWYAALSTHTGASHHAVEIRRPRTHGPQLKVMHHHVGCVGFTWQRPSRTTQGMGEERRLPKEQLFRLFNYSF